PRRAGGAGAGPHRGGGAGRRARRGRGVRLQHAGQLLPRHPRGHDSPARGPPPPLRRGRGGGRAARAGDPAHPLPRARLQRVRGLHARSPRPSILARRRRRVPTSVEIHNEVSREYTVLDVYTGDRVGLLFTITNTLYHLWLEIHLAKITTMVDQVLDVFYVTDHEGRK